MVVKYVVLASSRVPCRTCRSEARLAFVCGVQSNYRVVALSAQYIRPLCLFVAEVSVDDDHNDEDDEESSSNRKASRTSVTPPPVSPGARPKIWSIVDTATTEAAAARSPSSDSPSSSPRPPPPAVTAEQLLMASRLYGHQQAAAFQKQWYQAFAQNALQRPAASPPNASSPSP